MDFFFLRNKFLMGCSFSGITLLLGTVFGLAQSALATEGGGSNYLPGFYGDFAVAVEADKGTFLNNFFVAYQNGNGKAGSVLEMPGIVHVTEWDFFGGRYSWSVYPGVMGSWDRSGPNPTGRVGLADAYLVPVSLNWKWPGLAVLIFEGIVPPNGYYRKGELNLGRNVWTFDHIASLTWELPAHNELNWVLGYMNNTVNHATGYASGDEFHFDYTLAHYWRHEWSLGLCGSYYRQVTADHAPPGVMTAPQGEASTLGPAVMYATRIEGRELNLSLKWLHEFGVTGREAQDYLIWKVLVEF